MHPEALCDGGKKIFPRLKNFGDFYLAGGTAMALQMGHRVSVDFDLFSPTAIPGGLLGKVEHVFRGFLVKPLANNIGELSVLVDGTKVTFLHYPFPVMRGFVAVDGIQVLGVAELAATKAYTIGRRGTFKDYVDLYFALTEKYTLLQEVMELATQKYRDAFNARLFLEQLVYLQDITDAEILFLKRPVDKKEVEGFFSEEIKKLKL